jgi:hypothetical protein
LLSILAVNAHFVRDKCKFSSYKQLEKNNNDSFLSAAQTCRDTGLQGKFAQKRQEMLQQLIQHYSSKHHNAIFTTSSAGYYEGGYSSGGHTFSGGDCLGGGGFSGGGDCSGRGNY